MGKKVNAVLPGGRVVSVDEEDAQLANLPLETSQAEISRARGVVRTEENSGLGNAVLAGVEGAADTLTGGLAGKAIQHFGGDETAKSYQDRAQENPGARFVGEVGALLAPTGWFGAGAKAVAEASAVGLAARAGKAVGGGVKGQFVEGALLGVGGSVARTNVTGDPLTIESAFMDAGIGGIANAGMGLFASKMRSGALKAEERMAAQAAETTSDDAIAKGKQVFEREYPALDELNEARTNSVRQVDKANREIEKINATHAKFVKDPANGFTEWTEGVDRAINTVRSRSRPAGTFATMEEALGAAEQRAGVKADELNVNSQGAVPSQSVTEGATGASVAYRRGGVTPEGVRTSITDRVKLDLRPPRSPEVEARLTHWQREASEIRQLFVGKRKVSGAKWGPVDETIARQPDEAIARAHALKQDIWKHAQDAAGKIPDNLPSLPQKLLDAVPDVPRIKSAQYLSRMLPETVETIATTLSKEEALAVNKLAKELDLAPLGTPGETLKAIHKELKAYRSAMDAAEAAEKEIEKSAGSGFGRLLHHSARLVGARSGNKLLGGGVVGGAVGWATGNMFGGMAGAMLGSALLNGKAGIRNKITELFARHGAKAGSVLERLGPVTSALSRKVINGDVDDHSDDRTLAKNRAAELSGLMGVSGDLAYVALEPFLQAPHDIALKLSQKFQGAVQHLAQVAPKDPGLAIRGFDSQWTPSRKETLEFAHRYEAAVDPWASITRAMQGQGHPAAAETLWTLYPAVMTTFAEELAASTQVLETMTHGQLSSFSRLFRTPLSGFQVPEIALAAQSMYLPGGAGDPYKGNPGAGFGNSPSPQPQGGRPPAAGRSSVAGSNVSRLTE